MKRKCNNLFLSVIMVVTTMLTFTGCFSAPTETALMKEAGIEISITEYKIRLREFGYRFLDLVAHLRFLQTGLSVQSSLCIHMRVGCTVLREA